MKIRRELCSKIQNSSLMYGIHVISCTQSGWDISMLFVLNWGDKHFPSLPFPITEMSSESPNYQTCLELQDAANVSDAVTTFTLQYWCKSDTTTCRRHVVFILSRMPSGLAIWADGVSVLEKLAWHPKRKGLTRESSAAKRQGMACGTGPLPGQP